MPTWRGPMPDYLQPVRKGDKWHTYYRRAGQRFTIKGEPGTAEWWSNYAEIHAGFEPVRPDRPRLGTFAHVVAEYMESAKWLNLKDKTRVTYLAEIQELQKTLGDAKPDQITRPVIVTLRDRVAETKSARAAIERIKVLRILLGHAYDMGLVDRNHALKLPAPVGYRAEPWRPWTDDEIELFLKHAAPRWRRAVMVLLYTGLRVGDALSIRRKDIKGGILRWTASKTSVELVIPIHSSLAAELELPMEVESLYLIHSLQGRQIKLTTSVNHGIVREFKRLGIDKPPPVHGLRKNAVMRLLEVGCTRDEVRAMTGQSDEMIDHYGQKFDRERLSRAAVTKLETWKGN